MEITSKFPGRCVKCGGRINVGDRINWQAGNGSSHMACQLFVSEDEPVKSVTVTEPGVYESDNQVYVVKFNREHTRLYAKRLVEINAERATELGERVQIEFQYDRGAVYRLTPEDKMDVERAKALTIRYGRCIVCGRRLKAAESVERGIGPVCIKSFNSRSMASV